MFTPDDFLRSALQEDIGDGDHTSLSCIPEDARGKAHLLVKHNGVLAGVEAALQVFALVDDTLHVEVWIPDGATVHNGDVAFTVMGSSRSILQAERLALNLMQRMSGIASLSAQFVKACEGTKAVVLDTRKTTPNFRYFEKWAVRLGGAANHRMGLYDRILIKDNHIDFAGGIANALHQTRDYLRETDKNLPVEIEARNLAEVDTILETGIAERIMLDNFSLSATREAVERIGGRMETESSGGIALENVGDYARCGVDFISCGAVIHSAPNFDLSLKAAD